MDKKFHLIVLIVTKRKKAKDYYMPLCLLRLHRKFIGLRLYISWPDTLLGSLLEKEQEKEQDKQG